MRCSIWCATQSLRALSIPVCFDVWTSCQNVSYVDWRKRKLETYSFELFSQWCQEDCMGQWFSSAHFANSSYNLTIPSSSWAAVCKVGWKKITGHAIFWHHWETVQNCKFPTFSSSVNITHILAACPHIKTDWGCWVPLTEIEWAHHIEHLISNCVASGMVWDDNLDDEIHQDSISFGHEAHCETGIHRYHTSFQHRITFNFQLHTYPLFKHWLPFVHGFSILQPTIIIEQPTLHQPSINMSNQDDLRSVFEDPSDLEMEDLANPNVPQVVTVLSITQVYSTWAVPIMGTSYWASTYSYGTHCGFTALHQMILPSLHHSYQPLFPPHLWPRDHIIWERTSQKFGRGTCFIRIEARDHDHYWITAIWNTQELSSQLESTEVLLIDPNLKICYHDLIK